MTMMYHTLRDNKSSDVGAIAQELMDYYPNINAQVENKNGVPMATISNKEAINPAPTFMFMTAMTIRSLGYDVKFEDNGFAVYDNKGVLHARADMKNKQFQFYAHKDADPEYLTELVELYGIESEPIVPITVDFPSGLMSFIQRRKSMGEKAFNAKLENGAAAMDEFLAATKRPIRILSEEDAALFQPPKE
jgi:hypothetical protein|tara:strand:- start:303 stop:875 length:573 start_codon:yes stop_codon:yes gene_type:complete